MSGAHSFSFNSNKCQYLSCHSTTVPYSLLLYNFFLSIFRLLFFSVVLLMLFVLPYLLAFYLKIDDVHSIHRKLNTNFFFSAFYFLPSIFNVCYLDLNLFFAHYYNHSFWLLSMYSRKYFIAFTFGKRNNWTTEQKRRVMCLSFPTREIHCQVIFHFFTSALWIVLKAILQYFNHFSASVVCSMWNEI